MLLFSRNWELAIETRQYFRSVQFKWTNFKNMSNLYWGPESTERAFSTNFDSNINKSHAKEISIVIRVRSGYFHWIEFVWMYQTFTKHELIIVCLTKIHTHKKFKMFECEFYFKEKIQFQDKEKDNNHVLRISSPRGVTNVPQSNFKAVRLWGCFITNVMISWRVKNTCSLQKSE